ncbi:hypothetical protein JG687_00009154 [Phytophthora cactorum]|uniref:RXLR phytopathogen effector protein WY-domain domain-containing protein n=1 Tax=Phytophthora cactorum TaxID=29920 RepID=A0A8T1UAI4_9STRA|nr:hypothetical protein JG687_00009154 [Phytophthora cactorum]
MRLLCVMVLLVLFIFVAGTSTCYGAMDQTDLASSNLRFMRHAVAAAAASSRLLRSTAAETNEASTGDQGKEERAQLRRISAHGEIGLQGDAYTEKFLAWPRYMLQFRAKTGEDLFSNVKFLRLLREAKPDEEVLELLQSLRRVNGMKTLVDEMQAHLIKIYPSMMNEAWLKFRESPKEIHSFLHTNGLQDTNLIQWLRYIKMYRAKFGPSSFSVFQTYDLLLEHFSFASLAELLQSIKEIPDLEKLAKSMQIQVFQELYKHTSPNAFRRIWMGPSVLSKSDPMYDALEEYTLWYAAHRGGNDTLVRVKSLLAKDDIYAALDAAGKI